jgi:hypothetical protein
MKILVNIAEGWFNDFLKDLNLLDEETKKAGESRMLICKDCVVRTQNKCDAQKKGQNKSGFLFNGCGCNINKKTLCKECSCPGGYW